MAQDSGFWTTSGTPSGHQKASYDQADYSTAYRISAGADRYEGVVPDYQNELAPSTTGANNARVATGGAMVDGKYYENTANVDTTIPSSTTNDRIDRIVLRADWGSYQVTVYRIAGTEAPSPVPPAITQTPGTTFDIKICQARVNSSGTVTITDERDWAVAPVDGTTLENSGAVLRVKDNGISTAKIAADAVTNAKIGVGAVDTTELAADAVTGAKIADDQIDSEHYVAGSIDAEHLAANSVTSAAIAASAVDSDEIAADAVTQAKIAAGAVGNTELATDAVTASKIAAGAVDTSELATASVLSSKIGNDQVDSQHYAAGSIDAEHLAANSVIAGKIADGAVDVTAALANNIVDDTKVGNRVPQFYRRQGGSAASWATAGASNYTPGAVRMQGGAVSVGPVDTGNVGTTAVTFPVAFSQTPIVLATVKTSTYPGVSAIVTALSASSVQVGISNNSGFTVTLDVYWLAIGPE